MADEKQKEGLKDQVEEIVLADIKVRGPIFRTLMLQMKSELARRGQCFQNRGRSMQMRKGAEEAF